MQSVSPLDAEHPADNTIRFRATTMEMLEDSPVLTGRYYREYALAPEVRCAPTSLVRSRGNHGKLK